MEESKKNWVQVLGRTGTAFYVFIMLAAFPMYYTSMFHLTIDKRNFFLAATFCYVCTVLPSVRKPLIKADVLFIGLLLLAVALSTLLAEDRSMAFWEISDRSMNGCCFLCCIIIYLCIREYGAYDKIFLWGWVGGSSLLYLSGILCACGIDFLHIQDGLEFPEKYLTPLGNTNYNTCYVCIMLPFVMAMYLVCQKKALRVIYGINLYLGFLFTIFIKTESAVFAVLCGIALLACFALEGAGRFRRYVEITGIYVAAKMTVIVLLQLSGEYLYPFDGPGRIMMEGSWAAGELIIVLLLFGISRWREGKLRQWAAGKRKAFLCGAAAALAVFIIGVIWINAHKKEIPQTSFLQDFVLRDRYFSHRGFIWKRTVRRLRKKPLVRKLFGNGLNGFSDYVMTKRLQEESFLRFGWYYLDPHSEWLQMWADMGLLGVVGYFGLLGYTLVNSLGRWKTDPWQMAAALTLCVYMIQALANAYTIYHFPLLFIFLGMVNSAQTVGYCPLCDQ